MPTKFSKKVLIKVMAPKKRKMSSRHAVTPPPPQNPGKFMSKNVDELYDLFSVKPFVPKRGFPNKLSSTSISCEPS